MEDGRRETEVGRWKTEVGRWKTEDGSRKMEDGSRKMEDGSRKMEDGRQAAISSISFNLINLIQRQKMEEGGSAAGFRQFFINSKIIFILHPPSWYSIHFSFY
jgi:hypothetical protein